MIYFSQLINQNVWDGFGSIVGKLEDILIDGTEKKMPPIVALRLKKNPLGIEFIPANQIASLWPSITLRVGADRIKAYTPTGHELRLLDRVLDQQIVDTEGKRLVRVNDLQIARARELFVLTGVDVSGSGLLRRLGMEKIGRAVGNVINKTSEPVVIPWEFVASIEHDDPLRLSVSQNKLVKMPPADIAAIVDELDRHTSAAILEGFNNEALADTLEESSPDLQLTILSNMTPQRAADILEEMDPDEAADLLADLPTDTSEELLGLMEKDEALDLQTLLKYPEDTAGGIMTTEFSYVPDNITTHQAIDFLRNSEDASEDEVMYYVHIVDSQGRLKGIVTLRDLVMADPQSSLKQWEEPDVISVEPLTSQEDVAYLIAKYNLLSIPVVNPESEEMLGVVTMDDALDVVLPTAWKKRLPRLF
ncbi:MAG: CBS domain-containing protein [Brevefilum sp.]|nr:CBS domain-containing protein [Brevefilum sp.]MDT8380900.1 CBS domain-containing protein [Brevefilum sp.]MDW7754216.1 CBS domain-containing protein [Brevefilum sp.]